MAGFALEVGPGEGVCLIGQNGTGKTTRAMVRMLEKHRDQGGSFIVSTHQPEIMAPISSRLIILEEGAVHYDGGFTLETVEEFVEAPIICWCRSNTWRVRRRK